MIVLEVGAVRWLRGIGPPREVMVVRQVLFNRPAYRVRVLHPTSTDRGISDIVIDGPWLTLRKPREIMLDMWRGGTIQIRKHGEDREKIREEAYGTPHKVNFTGMRR